MKGGRADLAMKILIPALLSVFSLAAPDAAGQAVRIAGTGAAVGAMELLIAEYRRAHPGASFGPVEAIGSGGAIRAARAGALDIALVARPLSDADAAAGVRALEYARTPFVLAVASRAPVTALTRADLARIYAGDLDTWPEGTRVRPVLRPADDIDTRHLKDFGPEVGRAVEQALKRAGMLVASTDREAADILERTPGAIGPSTLGLIQSERRGLRALAMDGVAPTLQALESGAYPHHKRLYLVIGKKGLTPEAARFVEFVTSPAGKALLRNNGHLVPPFRGK
jgi:phosphate transport system substrate-binding protein